MDPLFWILSGVVAGCLIGIIILWRLEARAEQQLAAQRQAEDASSASLPVVDPHAELERLDTRPVPAMPLPTPADRASALQVPTPPTPADRVSALQAPSTSALPVEDLPTAQQTAPALEALPTNKLATPALEELPTSKLPSLPVTSQQAATPQKDQPAHASGPPGVIATPGAAETPPLAPVAQLQDQAAVSQAKAQEMALATPGQARLRLAELARERGYLEHTLEANQIKLEELQRGPVLPDSEEALALSGLQGEIARQRQRLQEIDTLEAGYRQIAAAWEGQVSKPTRQTDQRPPKAFGARRLSRPHIERAGAEQPEEEPPPPSPPA